MSKTTVRELQSILDSLSDDLVDAEVELHAAQQRVEDLKIQLSAIATSIAIVEAQPVVDADDQPYKVIRNAAVEVLREKGRPMHYKQLHDELIRRGIDIPGKNSLRNFSAHLSNDSRFVRVDTGTWGLITQMAGVVERESGRRPNDDEALGRPDHSQIFPAATRVRNGVQMPVSASSRSVNFIGEKPSPDSFTVDDIDDIPF